MGNILIRGATVLTMESSDSVFEDGEIAIAGDRIASAGPRGSAPEGFSPEKIIDGSGKVVMPGFVNSHTHAAMTLFRGYADDMPLMKWLSEKIWPAEERLQPEDIYWGTMLCCLEMIKSGTTSFADMYFEMDMVARAVEECGMRACLSRGMIGVAPTARKAVEESAALVEQWHGGANGRIRVMFGPHAPYTCPPDYLKEVIGLAGRYGVGIHMHVSETGDEVEQIKSMYGTSPVKYLDSLGLFELPVLAAHCVHLDESDIEILASKKVGIAHCPESNMKLASGVSPVARLINSGAPVGLGTDGAASNNNLDMFEEMHCASLLQKVTAGDPTVLPSYTALKLATAGGAQAIGFPDLGLLKPGMKADLIMIEFNKPHLCPRHDVMAHLVYSARSADVDTVVIDGEIVMEGRKVLTMDEDEVMNRAQLHAFRLAGEKG
ncbi:MAG TPA: amidohydrolase [Bacillota bacterium]|nr:amidohydrolase [Bacillota bacterium]